MFGNYAHSLGSISSLGYPVRTMNIGSGENAAHNTIIEMIKIIKESSNNPYVRKRAEQIMQNVPARNTMAEAAAIYYFIRDNCAYRLDPIDLEYLMTPPLTLSKIDQGIIPQMDCDDYALLACSLARSIGIPAALKITKYFNSPEWSHIYALFLVGSLNDGTGLHGIQKHWIPIDAIKNDKPFLWEAPNPTASKIFYIE